MSDLLTNILNRLGATLDNRGRGHADCPFCGHVVSRRGYHFYVYDASYGRGYVCWSCGARGSLAELAQHLDVHGVEAPQKRPERPKPTPPWCKPGAAEQWRRNAQSRLERATRLWQAYKPLSAATIARYGLSVGRVPLWAEPQGRKPGKWYGYRHERLLLPLWRGDNIIGIVARAYLPQDDGPKWLAASFSDISSLYNIESVTPGSTVIVCENRVDALLAQERDSRAIPVAIGGARWQEEWTQALIARQPRKVIVWLDNDLAGCPNARAYDTGINEWRRKMEQRLNAGQIRAIPPEPQPRGPKIANELARAGLNATVYHWRASAAYRADLGALVMEVAA